jgi:hypothetical protein
MELEWNWSVDEAGAGAACWALGWGAKGRDRRRAMRERRGSRVCFTVEGVFE